MAAESKGNAAKLAAEDDTPAARQEKPAETKPAAEQKRRVLGECIVDDGTPHMGRATPGAKICSAHAMHYKADGTRRT